MKKIGMIGMSEGNAHPYSWSSIINGVFDGDEIAEVGYPAVSAYLKANEDTLGIPGAQVTHIWTQDISVSQSIAKSANIPYVVSQMEEMIGHVDAVILGRDDPENHVAMAKPFIDADVPIFVDKPLIFSRQDLEWFTEQHDQGKFIMSCSSMRYANECRIVKQGLAALGEIEFVTATGKKDWKKYGIHLLEGVFSLLDDPRASSVQYVGGLDREMVHVHLANGKDLQFNLFQHISGTFQISVFGQKDWKFIDIKNSYSMFRDNLIEFVRSLYEGKPRLEFEKTKHLMEIVVAAEESRKQGGNRIYL